MKFCCFFLLLFLQLNNALADYDNGMRYVFVASPNSKSVSIIDLHDQRLAETIQLKQTPGTVTASDRLDALVVAYPSTNQLALVDLSSSKLKQYEYSLDISPDYIKLNPVSDGAAIYDKEKRVLQIHNLKRRKSLITIENVNTRDLITFNRDGQQVFWVDPDTGYLHVSDLWGKANKLQLTSKGDGLSAMTRSVDGAFGFVSDAIAAKVYVINLRSMKLLKEVRVGNGPLRPWGTADGQTMIVPNKSDGTITGISTFTFDAIYTINAVEKPVTVNTGWLDTTAAVIGESGHVALINLIDRKTIKKFQLAGKPQAAVVTSNSRTLALPVEGFGNLFLFDMKSYSLEERIIDLPKDIGNASLAISNNLCH